MPRHNDWWSAFDVVKPWGTQWIALTRALAELEDLREEVLGCLTPEGTMPSAGGHGAAASRDGKIDLGDGTGKHSVTRGTHRATSVLRALGITDLDPPAPPQPGQTIM